MFFWIFWNFPEKWKPLIGWDTALLKSKICVLQRDSEPKSVSNLLIWPSFHSKWSYIDRGSSWDHFWHFWNFSQFFCFSDFFWKLPKKWKPLIGWDTTLLKLKICVLQRDSELNTATNSLIWPLLHSQWPHIDGGSSGDHFWHFWNFAEFLCFSEFFGNSLKNENPLLAEIQRF